MEPWCGPLGKFWTLLRSCVFTLGTISHMFISFTYRIAWYLQSCSAHFRNLFWSVYASWYLFWFGCMHVRYLCHWWSALVSKALLWFLYVLNLNVFSWYCLSQCLFATLHFYSCSEVLIWMIVIWLSDLVCSDRLNWSEFNTLLLDFDSSFNDKPVNETAVGPIGKELFEREQDDLLSDLKDIPKKACDRRVCS